MCGIAGFFDGNADFTANREKYENILQKMQQSILHRGPDEQGIYLGKRAGLAHTRLRERVFIIYRILSCRRHA